jgi:arginase
MIGVVGIPFDEFSSFLHGPEKAPPLIRDAYHSDSANYFTESGIDLNLHTGWKDHGECTEPVIE